MIALPIPETGAIYEAFRRNPAQSHRSMIHIKAWLKAQWQGVVAGLFATALTLCGIFVPILMNRENAVGAARLAEFQAIASQQEEFNALLQSFTLKVNDLNQSDPQLVANLTENLSRQYSRVGTFVGNLDSEGKAAADRYRTSLNGVKTNLQRLKMKTDLNPLSVALVEMYRSQSALNPLMLRSTGRANATDSP